MSIHEYHPHDRIAALATPVGSSALALVRLSGEGSIIAVSSFFSRGQALVKAKGNTVLHGEIIHPDSGKVIDEVMVTVYRAPRSFTGEEAVEIMPHGSIPGVRKILDLLFSSGFREAAPGEFTLRAFLNGKMNLTEAEAIRELIEAKTIVAHDMALNRLRGGLSAQLEDIRARVLTLVSRVELALDYPEEEIGGTEDTDPFDNGVAVELVVGIEKLLDGFRVGRIYQDGVRVVLAGATNSGKSSLFNLLLREERSIVSSVHGTTRDYIESWISIRDLPVRLFDTAGLRRGGEPIESEGIRRTEALLAEADCIVYLVDATKGVSDVDRRQIAQFPGGRCVRVWSKSDLVRDDPPRGFLSVSSVTGDGLSALEDAVFDSGGGVTDEDEAMYLESDHQRRCLVSCRDALNRAIAASGAGYPLDAVATDLADASTALGELTGEITRAEILETIFSRFCVGK